MDSLIVQFGQLGVIGLFAYLMLRHVLKGSSDLALMLHNHMEEDNKVQHSIYKSLEAIKYSLQKLHDK